MIRFIFVSAVGACASFFVLVALGTIVTEWGNFTRREQRIAKIGFAICAACGLVAGLTSLFFR